MTTFGRHYPLRNRRLTNSFPQIEECFQESLVSLISNSSVSPVSTTGNTLLVHHFYPSPLPPTPANTTSCQDYCNNPLTGPLSSALGPGQSLVQVIIKSKSDDASWTSFPGPVIPTKVLATASCPASHISSPPSFTPLQLAFLLVLCLPCFSSYLKPDSRFSQISAQGGFLGPLQVN